MYTIAWPEPRLLKPTSHKADFRFDEAFPEVSIGLNLQPTNRRVRFKLSGRFSR